jgi:CheY-like chemotaxis protein
MGESTTQSRERVKVLIVEDNPDQRDLLRRHFEIAGCDVTVAESAESAIVAYQGAELDLAVIDLLLPGMDGWALSKRISADHPDCPVAISSVLDPDDYPVSKAVLPKPVTRASVREVLLNCVPGWVAP